MTAQLARAARWLARELAGSASVWSAASSDAHPPAERLAHQRRTAENLAALLSLTSGPAHLRPEPLDLGDLVMTVLPGWKPRAPRHSFELALLGETPLIVADGERVAQAIDRLLAAVVRATPLGTTVRVSVRPGTADPEEVVLTVRHGDVVGLRGALPPHTTDPFADYFEESGPEDPARAAPNGALDLTLAREIVAAHGGRLEIEAPTQALRRNLAIVTTWPLVPRLAPPGEALRGAPESTAGLGPAGAPIVERAQPVLLVVEAEPRMARFLKANLEARGYCALVAQDVSAARRMADLEAPDLILLDGELAGDERMEPLRHLIADGGCPVLILARKSDPLACVRALDLGADDWIARPFHAEELLARVRAALRRRVTDAKMEDAGPITVGELTVDLAQRLVTVSGTPVALSKTEYKLLSVLAGRQGAVLAHEALLERVWGPGYSDAVEFVWVYIRRLRRKLEADPACPRYILTVPGLGYRLAER